MPLDQDSAERQLPELQKSFISQVFSADNLGWDSDLAAPNLQSAAPFLNHQLIPLLAFSVSAFTLTSCNLCLEIYLKGLWVKL